jgi:hypothetical protein
MATATGQALELRLFGSSLSAAVKNNDSEDLLQVVNEGGKCVWKLSSTGVATVNPPTHTGQALLGRFFGSSLATAFTNTSKQDLLQVVNQGGKVVYHVSSTGVATTP